MKLHRIKTLEQVKSEEKIGDVFETKEFLELVDCGAIIDYDGYGHPHNGKKKLENISILDYLEDTDDTEEQICKKYPYVVWFNR